MYNPARQALPDDLRNRLQLHRTLRQNDPSRSSMEREVKDAVAVSPWNKADVVNELLGSVASEMDEPYAVSPGNEFENGEDAEPFFEVMIPKGFEANNVLFITSRQSHRNSLNPVDAEPCVCTMYLIPNAGASSVLHGQ